MHILLPLIDNCPTWISGREIMTLEIISWPISTKGMWSCRGACQCFWLDFCFTALQHILGHFRRSQLPLTHCFWARLLGSLPAHSFTSNWQLLFLNQQKRENGHRNFFMPKSPRKNVPDMGIKFRTACMPSRCASDRVTVLGGMSECHDQISNVNMQILKTQICLCFHVCWSSFLFAANIVS